MTETEWGNPGFGRNARLREVTGIMINAYPKSAVRLRHSYRRYRACFEQGLSCIWYHRPMKKTFECRLYPTKHQKTESNRTLDGCQVL